MGKGKKANEEGTSYKKHSEGEKMDLSPSWWGGKVILRAT